MRVLLPAISLFLFTWSCIGASGFIIADMRGKVRLEEGSRRRYDVHPNETIKSGTVIRTYRGSDLFLKRGDRFYRIYSSSRVRIDEEPVLIYGRLSRSQTPWFFDLHFYFSPRPAQGRTMKLVVWSGEEEIEVHSSLINNGGEERSLRMYPQGKGKYIALTGFDIEAPPLKYNLDIKVLKENGDFTRIVYPFYLAKTGYGKGRVYLSDRAVELLKPSEEKQREREILSQILSNSVEQKLWEGLFGYPVAHPSMLSEYGRRRIYYINNKFSFVRHHRGADFKAKRGDAIYNPNNGLVVFAGERITTGNTVVIDHGQGVLSMFFHLDSLSVSEGTMSWKGEKIGEAGSTGISEGVHIHWSLVVDRIFIDPADWVKRLF